MLGIVKEVSGQKQIIPLTTDTGTGAPVGTLIQQYKKKPMSGYLYCDGSTFDQNAYPALYMYLGSNVLPDYSNNVENGYVYIKATSGLAENQQDNVLKNVKDYVDNSNSYSTQEVKTGGKWIDGKPIYRKTFIYNGETTANEHISMGNISNVEDIETIKGTLRLHAGGFISLGYMNNDNNKVFEVNIMDNEVRAISPYNSSNSKIVITVEYTKTTD